MDIKASIQEYEDLSAEVDFLREQIAALTIQKKQYEMKMEEIEEQPKNQMIGAQMNRAIIAGWKINISKSTSTVIEAEDELPDQYWRIERKPDLMKVKEDLKLGITVEGAILVTRQNISLKKREPTNI